MPCRRELHRSLRERAFESLRWQSEVQKIKMKMRKHYDTQKEMLSEFHRFFSARRVERKTPKRPSELGRKRTAENAPTRKAWGRFEQLIYSNHKEDIRQLLNLE